MIRIRYVTVHRGNGFDSRPTTTALSRPRKTAQPRVQYRRPHDRRSRPAALAGCSTDLLDLQGEYQAWLDNLPDSLQESALAQQLEAIAGLILPHWRASRRHAGSGATEGPRSLPVASVLTCKP